MTDDRYSVAACLINLRRSLLAYECQGFFFTGEDIRRMNAILLLLAGKAQRMANQLDGSSRLIEEQEAEERLIEAVMRPDSNVVLLQPIPHLGPCSHDGPGSAA